MSVKVARNSDAMLAPIRAREQFRSKTRPWSRDGTYGPIVSMSGTEPCHGRGCVEVVHETDNGRGGTNSSSVQLCHSTGSLPEAYRDSLDMADYVVRSFATPIAWHIDYPMDLADTQQMLTWIDGPREQSGHWVVPNVAYSITTYQHQRLVDCALGSYWRMDYPPALTTQNLSIPGAPTRVRSGTR